MANLRHIHQYMRERRRVLLEDGRTGNIVRVDTTYPLRSTTVSVWTQTTKGPGLAKVDLQSVIGPAPDAEEGKQAAG